MMVNTKHDTTSYENCSCQREIYDGNALYDAYLRAKISVGVIGNRRFSGMKWHTFWTCPKCKES